MCICGMFFGMYVVPHSVTYASRGYAEIGLKERGWEVCTETMWLRFGVSGGLL